MLSIISFNSSLLYSSNVSFSLLYFHSLAFSFFLSLSLSLSLSLPFSAFRINPSLHIFNLAFIMNLVDSDDLGAYGFKPKTKTKAQGLSTFLNKTIGRTVWFQIEK